MAKLQPVRGTHDLLPQDARLHHHVISTFRRLAALYGFEPLETPIFEFTEVFDRTLGETSDVVTKEMYTFTDKGGDSLTLRPEPTAGVARAFISNGLSQHVPVKVSIAGPMFRYERPQKGRLRQFHQLGVEILGAAEPQADVEVIALGAHLLEELGITNSITLQLNTLGDPDSRAAYHAVLVDYFNSCADKLSDESRDRLERNPLRILDSKEQQDRALIAEAPRMGDHLNQLSQDFYGAVKLGLDELGIAYEENDKLVRGFDYYTHTAFEFVSDALGAQGTVIGGGRYDRLVEHMGGPKTPGIGWGSGIERLCMLLSVPETPLVDVAIVPVGASTDSTALSLSQTLRRAGVSCDMAYKGNMGKRLKRADKIGARFAIIVGEDELADGQVIIRDLSDGSQDAVDMNAVVEALALRLSK